MSWIAKLYETYEQALKLDDSSSLLPIAHTLQNAHINICIDGEGNFIEASVLDKTQIILPATESSAGRSSGEAPHPLADKLQYLAKDYPIYGGKKNSYFASYQEQLEQWCKSNFAHPKAKAVLRYVDKGEVIKDLVSAKILHVDETSALLSRWSSNEEQPALFKVLPKKSGEVEQGDALVSWSVMLLGEPQAKTWEDESLQNSWVAYDASQGAQAGFCFITDQDVPLAVNHPAKLRHTGDKAKLISSNDKDGFTYLGRFLTNNQACGIGFEVTQKAHNALRWLISRQGYRNGDQVIIAWALSGKELPSPAADRWKPIEDDFDEIRAEATAQEKIDHGKNLGQIFAEKLNKKLAGYTQNISDHESIILMIIDSATPGRMSIAYYQEFSKKDFFDRIESWHTDFAWPQRVVFPSSDKKIKSTVVWYPSAPAPWLISKVAYGENVDDKLKKSTVERLIPCIVEEKSISRDLVESCMRNASNPQAYKNDEKWRWNRNISVACALYKGYRARHPNTNERRNYAMSLERNYNSRDYLYGRLLAVAEQIERRALDDNGKGRITNAEGLMQRFSQHPLKTWTTIHDHLVPYRNRLRVSKPQLLWYWESELKEIHDLFGEGEERKKIFNDEPLSGEYLLGYYCQKNYKKPKKTTDGEVIKIDDIEELTNEEGQ